jgi:hypothetical protein
MMSEYEISRSYKLANASYQLNPGYLFEIGWICKTPNWLSQINRNNVPVTKIRVEKRG